MPVVAQMKNIGPEFRNEKQIARVVYDFAVDGGATGAYDVFTAGSDVVITGAHAYVKTACTSGGSATVAYGITGSTTAFVDATAGAVANLTADAVLGAAEPPIRLASGSKVLMTVGTAALTAGKIEFVVEYMSA